MVYIQFCQPHKQFLYIKPNLEDQLQHFEHFVDLLEPKSHRDHGDAQQQLQQQQDLQHHIQQQHDEHQHTAEFRPASGRSVWHSPKHPRAIAQYSKPGGIKGAMSGLKLFLRLRDAVGWLEDQQAGARLSGEHEHVVWRRGGRAGKQRVRGRKEDKGSKKFGDAQLLKAMSSSLLAGGSTSSSDLTNIVLLKMLGRMEKSETKKDKKKKDADELWNPLGGSASDCEEENTTFRPGGMKAMNKMQNRVRSHPKSTCLAFEEEAASDLGMNHPESILDSQRLALQASVGPLQGPVPVQAAIDGGDWTAAWLLTCLSDPMGRREFGGSKSEMAVVSGYLRPQQAQEASERSGGRKRSPPRRGSRSCDQDQEVRLPKGEGGVHEFESFEFSPFLLGANTRFRRFYRWLVAASAHGHLRPREILEASFLHVLYHVLRLCKPRESLLAYQKRWAAGRFLRLEYCQAVCRAFTGLGCYLDDLLITQVCDLDVAQNAMLVDQFPSPQPEDGDAKFIASAEEAYRRVGSKRAEHKAFRHQVHFKAGKRVLQQFMGYLRSAFEYRRELYSLARHIYKYVDGLDDGAWYRLPLQVCDELRSIFLHLPLAKWNMRRSVSKSILTTDARVSKKFARALFDWSISRGGEACLETQTVQEEIVMRGELERHVDKINQLGDCLRWKVTGIPEGDPSSLEVASGNRLWCPALELAELMHNYEGYVTLEHPLHSKAWQPPQTRRLADSGNFLFVQADWCAYSSVQRANRKPMQFLTIMPWLNSACLRCPGNHIDGKSFAWQTRRPTLRPILADLAEH
eukprot:s1638_g8.t1